MARSIMGIITLTLIAVGPSYCETTRNGRERLFSRLKDTDDVYNPVRTHRVRSFVECGLKCLIDKEKCAFVNYKAKTDVDGDINCQILTNTKTIKTHPGIQKWTLYKALSPCEVNNSCENGGKCIEKLLPPGFSCKCDPRYTGNKCQTKIVVESTCSALKEKYPDTPSGSYNINPDTAGDTNTDIYCNMTSKNGVGVTEMRHDSQAPTKVDGYEEPGSYSRDIIYDINMALISAIINASSSCEQFIKYECFSSAFYYKSITYHWWVSRQGTKMLYWGGADSNTTKCACGMTDSCHGGGKCNCNENDAVLREDSGFLTDKNALPVTQLRFGDSDKYSVAPYFDEYGIHTLGPLLCWG